MCEAHTDNFFCRLKERPSGHAASQVLRQRVCPSVCLCCVKPVTQPTILRGDTAMVTYCCVIVWRRSWQKNGNLGQHVCVCIYSVCVREREGDDLLESVHFLRFAPQHVLTWWAWVCVHACLLTSSCLLQCLGCPLTHRAPTKTTGLIGFPRAVGLTHAVAQCEAALLLTPVNPHLLMSHLSTDKPLHTLRYLQKNYARTCNQLRYNVFIALFTCFLVDFYFSLIIFQLSFKSEYFFPPLCKRWPKANITSAQFLISISHHCKIIVTVMKSISLMSKQN